MEIFELIENFNKGTKDPDFQIHSDLTDSSSYLQQTAYFLTLLGIKRRVFQRGFRESFVSKYFVDTPSH